MFNMYIDLIVLCTDTGMGCDQGLCNCQMTILTGHVQCCESILCKLIAMTIEHMLEKAKSDSDT